MPDKDLLLSDVERRVAVDGEDGWRLLQQQGADLLISDVDMPRMGREVARLERAGFDFRTALLYALQARGNRLETGMTHAHAAAADWLALLDRRPQFVLVVHAEQRQPDRPGHRLADASAIHPPAGGDRLEQRCRGRAALFGRRPRPSRRQRSSDNVTAGRSQPRARHAIPLDHRGGDVIATQRCCDSVSAADDGLACRRHRRAAGHRSAFSR